MFRRAWLIAVALTATAACTTDGSDDASRPGVTPRDASQVAIDAGVSATPDATLPGLDAAPLDDAGATPDAGTSTPDAGTSTPDAGVGAPDSGAPSAPDASVGFPDATSGAPDTGPTDPGPAVLNPGWIGGPCSTDADCPFTDGRCLPASSGYPGGTCVRSCSRLCPDLSGPLNSVTFCVDDGDGDADGQCMSRCDNTLSPTGCRNGYVCLPEKRMNQSTVVRNVCVPRTGIPGRAAPPFDIGAACVNAADCNRNTCLGLPGGYCSQEACNIVGCPTGSRCFRLGLEDYHVCLKTCSSSSQCRQAESYVCDSDSTCWYQQPMRPACDLSGGAADCAAYASQTSRNFVVVTKSKRRVVLCDGAREVQTYCAGLGSSPILDKEREGDRRTPEGIFYIPRLIPNSQYYKAFLLSYPDDADAQRGLQAGLITQSEHDAIVRAQQNRREPPQFTNLGGLIEIHGRGSSSDWTWGCIAMDDAAVDDLWRVLQVGDNIVVLH